MWTYPEESRILDALSEEPDRFFTLEELREKAGISPFRKTAVLDLLRALVQRGAVVEAQGKMWAIRTEDPHILKCRVKNFIKADCKRQLLILLNTYRCMDIFTAKTKMRVNIAQHENFRSSGINDIDRLADEILNELMIEGHVKLIGDIVCRAGDEG